MQSVDITGVVSFKPDNSSYAIINDKFYDIWSDKTVKYDELDGFDGNILKEMSGISLMLDSDTYSIVYGIGTNK